MPGRTRFRRKGKEGQTIADERKTYYVAVGAGQILEDMEAAPFEFAIRATEEEISKLQKMFERLSDEDEAAMVEFTGFLSTEDRHRNEPYADRLKDIYGYLYELGTDETKRHIEERHLLH